MLEMEAFGEDFKRGTAVEMSSLEISLVWTLSVEHRASVERS